MFYLFFHAIRFKYLIIKFNWEMKFSLFLLIPLVYTLRTQYAPQNVNLNKVGVVVGRSSLRVHSSSRISLHGPVETNSKEKPWALLQINLEDTGYEPYRHLPFQKMILPIS